MCVAARRRWLVHTRLAAAVESDFYRRVVTFSPDGSHVLVGSQLRRVPDLHVVRDMGDSWANCFSRDGSILALSLAGNKSDQPLVHLYETATGEQLPVTFPKPVKTTRVYGLCFVSSQQTGWFFCYLLYFLAAQLPSMFRRCVCCLVLCSEDLPVKRG